jgi:hypothetical protein
MLRGCGELGVRDGLDRIGGGGGGGGGSRNAMCTCKLRETPSVRVHNEMQRCVIIHILCILAILKRLVLICTCSRSRYLGRV